MNYLRKILLALPFLLVLSCSEDEEPSLGSPWFTTISMGNFTINSANVVTSQDGVTIDYIADYVYAAALPSSDFRFISINAYVPTEEAYSVNIDPGTTVIMTNENLESTGNLFDEVSFVQRIELGGQLYSVFHFEAYHDSDGFIPATFANIVFTIPISYYVDGKKKGNRTVKLEVYKRD